MRRARVTSRQTTSITTWDRGGGGGKEEHGEKKRKKKNTKKNTVGNGPVWPKSRVRAIY